MSLEPWLSCRDIRRSLSFYTEILDFSVVAPPDPDPASFGAHHAVLARDGDMLHLDSHAREKGCFCSGFYVRVDNIDALFSAFITNGLVIAEPNLRAGPIDQSWGMREFWCADPDGNRICFGQEL